MSYVKDILARKGTALVAVSAATSVYDALEIMAKKNIGSVLVMEDDKYLGIASERDYSRKVILKNKHSNNTTVAEIMSTDLPRIFSTDSVKDCMELMATNNVRYLPVFDDNQLKGIISMSDVVRETILEQQQTIDHLNTYINS
jgi:CBS domain-containing protein